MPQPLVGAAWMLGSSPSMTENGGTDGAIRGVGDRVSRLQGPKDESRPVLDPAG